MSEHSISHVVRSIRSMVHTSRRSLVIVFALTALLLSGFGAALPAHAGSGYLSFKVYVCKVGLPNTCKVAGNWNGFMPSGKFLQPVGLSPERYYEVYVLDGQNSTITYKQYTVTGEWGSYALYRTRTCSPAVICTLLDIL
jgi:hypothetical protein